MTSSRKNDSHKSDSKKHDDDKKRKEKKDKHQADTAGDIDQKQALSVGKKVAQALFGCCGALFARNETTPAPTPTPPVQDPNAGIEMKPVEPVEPASTTPRL